MSIWNIGDRFGDYIFAGKKTYDEANEQIAQASKEAQEKISQAIANQKSIKDLYSEGRQAAAQTANDKAGIAKKNAKAAAMMNNNSKLLAAIQGAQAANDAVSSGYDSTASQAMQAGLNQQQKELDSAIQGANLGYNATAKQAQNKIAQSDRSANQIQNTFGMFGKMWE